MSGVEGPGGPGELSKAGIPGKPVVRGSRTQSDPPPAQQADVSGAAGDPLGVEPGPETLALIAEFQAMPEAQIVDRVLADRRCMLAVLRLEKSRQQAIAVEITRRLPTIGELAKELAEDPLILSLLALLSEDIRRQAMRALGLPEDRQIPSAPGNRVKPPPPPESGGGLNRYA